MKSLTKKISAGKFRLAIPLLLISLSTSPIPAEAGLLDTVNNKVSNILNRVKAIGANTSGLQDVTTSMRDVRDNLGGGMIDNMRDTIEETRELIQFIKDRRDSAGQTSQYPSLPNLVRSLSDVSDVLTNRDGQGGALESLSALLNVLPDKALAPVARAVSKAGVDADFVARIDEMATSLVEIREILKDVDARRELAAQAAELYMVEGDGLLIAEFGCHIRDNLQLVRLSRATRAVKKTADTVKVIGALIDAKSGAFKLEKGAGIFGWVSVEPKTDVKGVTGKLLGIAADGALVLVESADNVISKCVKQVEQDLANAA